jgi:hypothetical protein
VYLIEQPKISKRKAPPNLGPLAEHGDTQLVLPAGNFPTFSSRKCFELIERSLFPDVGHVYDPEFDYLVWAGGDTLSAIMVGMLLAEREIFCFKWLRYERKKLEDGSRTDEGATYVPCVIDLCDPQLDLEMPANG